jgi:hypothetical protein
MRAISSEEYAVSGRDPIPAGACHFDASALTRSSRSSARMVWDQSDHRHTTYDNEQREEDGSNYTTDARHFWSPLILVYWIPLGRTPPWSP